MKVWEWVLYFLLYFCILLLALTCVYINYQRNKYKLWTNKSRFDVQIFCAYTRRFFLLPIDDRKISDSHSFFTLTRHVPVDGGRRCWEENQQEGWFLCESHARELGKTAKEENQTFAKKRINNKNLEWNQLALTEIHHTSFLIIHWMSFTSLHITPRICCPCLNSPST